MHEAEREALGERILDCAGSAACEAIVSSHAHGLTRFTHNAIHQNIASIDAVVRVRIVAGKRTGVAETNDLSGSGLRATLARAGELAALAPCDDARAPLAYHPRVATPPGSFVAATAHTQPSQRTAIVAAVAHEAESAGLWTAGYTMTAHDGITLVNSAGTRLSFDATDCALNVKANGVDSTGFAEQYASDVGRLDGSATAAIATSKAVSSAQPQSVDPGSWTVILEPPAFGELLSYLTPHFSAQAVDAGSSFLRDGLDRPYAGEQFTLEDDFTHPLHLGMPFDGEGSPRSRLTLVDHGVARAFVTDATWARKLGRPNTGHGFPAPDAEPRPLHLVVAAGPKSLAQLIAQTKRGLLVSRFWYIRPIDQHTTIVTGMTRDGTFLIEDGCIVRGVRNLRFNQNILEALQHAEFADTQVRTAAYNYSLVIPAVKLNAFRFTSLTDF